MKNTILTLSFVAVLGLTAVSCSTDDSALENDIKSTELNSDVTLDNGDKDLPRPRLKG